MGLGTRHRPWWAAAAVLGVGCLWLLAPGVITYDGLSQYSQAVSGSYDDWHPPIVARLWSLFLALGLRGSAAMFAFQIALYWAGLGLLAGAFAARGHRKAAAAALAIGLFPITLDWMDCVLKDGQMLGAMLAATGLVAQYRLAERRLPIAAIAVAALLLAYATLARANAVFATVPLALGFAGWRGWRWVAATFVGIVAAIGVSGPINHAALGAERSHVERTLAVFDMAGIAHRAHLATLPDLDPAIWAEAERTHCYTPFYWDPLGDTTKCGAIASTLAFNRDDDAPSIWGEWAMLIAHHPIAYAGHRLAHLNATLRIAMPSDERSATAPVASLADPSGIGQPARRAAVPLQRVATVVAATPLGVPGWWLLLAAALWWTLAGCPPQPSRALGIAVAGSAVLMTLAFAVVGIASDLRYHLWLMTGTLVAATLLATCDGVPRRRLTITLGVAIVAAGLSVMLRR